MKRDSNTATTAAIQTGKARKPAGADLDVDHLSGVWQRTLLIEPDGRRDEKSAVFWLQLGALCGDIRAPADTVGADTAFAGSLVRKGDVFRWIARVARGSVTNGAPDEGRLRFEGDVLREDGVHQPYVEHWRRVGPPARTHSAFEFKEPLAHAPGLFIDLAPFAFCARPGLSKTSFALTEMVGGVRVMRLAIDWPWTKGSCAWPRVNAQRLSFPAPPLGHTGDGEAWTADLQKEFAP
ncbi:MAG: hypothetical protein AAGB11_10395 [Pseudomonadota bacterium]